MKVQNLSEVMGQLVHKSSRLIRLVDDRYVLGYLPRQRYFIPFVHVVESF
jgi:hypothetical protein